MASFDILIGPKPSMRWHRNEGEPADLHGIKNLAQKQTVVLDMLDDVKQTDCGQ